MGVDSRRRPCANRRRPSVGAGRLEYHKLCALNRCVPTLPPACETTRLCITSRSLTSIFDCASFRHDMSINSTVLETNVNLEVIHPRSILKWSIEVQSRSGPAVCAVAHNLATFLTARVETVRRRAFGSEGTSYHLILEDNERLFRSLVVIRGMCPCVHDSRHDKDKQENSVTTLFDLSAPDTRRYKMQWPFLILLTSLATVGIVAQATGQEVAILIGAGCAFSDYSTLPKATTSVYNLTLDLGRASTCCISRTSIFLNPMCSY